MQLDRQIDIGIGVDPIVGGLTLFAQFTAVLEEAVQELVKANFAILVVVELVEELFDKFAVDPTHADVFADPIQFVNIQESIFADSQSVPNTP